MVFSNIPSTPASKDQQNQQYFVKSYFQPQSVVSNSAGPSTTSPAHQGGFQPATQSGLYPSLSNMASQQQPTGFAAVDSNLRPQVPQEDSVSSIYDVFNPSSSSTLLQSQQMQNNPSFHTMSSSATPAKQQNYAGSSSVATPMSVSPAFAPSSARPLAQQSPSHSANGNNGNIGGLVGMSPSQQITRQPYQNLNPAYPNMVTVFGFPAEISSAILNLFRNYGNIVSFEFVGNCNWMNVEFENELQARMALGKNGMIVDEIMIGVVPMKQSHESGYLDSKRSSLSSVLSPLKKTSPFTTSAGSASRLVGSSSYQDHDSFESSSFTPLRTQSDQRARTGRNHQSQFDTPIAPSHRADHSRSVVPQSHTKLKPAPLATPQHARHRDASFTSGNGATYTSSDQQSAPPGTPSLLGKFVESFLGW